MRTILFLLLLVPALAFSQKNHTVGPKETLFSIGRLYKVHPRELAAFNNIPYESGLTIGQVLKIPSKTTMPPLPTVAPTAAPVEKTVTDTKPVEKVVAKPVEKKPAPVKSEAIYHVVKKKENLYQISRMYNKVPIDDLKKWNKLSSDALSEGTKLIVGYKKEEKAPTIIEKFEPVQTPVVKTEEPPKNNVPEKPVVVPPVVIEKPQVENRTSDYKGGVFKSVYESQSNGNEQKTEEGMAGIFKTSSGWNDGKYYCLHNDLVSGTVIKVTNKQTGKSIYAKVLDAIPDIKMNEGLVLLISSSAANELGAGETNFNCTINYSK